VLNFLHEQSRIFSAQALFSRIPGQCCVDLGETVSGATSSFWTRSRKGGEAAGMVFMIWQQRRHQDGAVEEPSHRAFFRRGARAGGLPRKLSSRSRRIWRSASSVDSAEIGSPVLKTQIPCFLCNPTPPLRGRSTMTKHNAAFRAFQFQRVACAELHFIPHRLRQDDASSFV